MPGVPESRVTIVQLLRVESSDLLGREGDGNLNAQGEGGDSGKSIYFLYRFSTNLAHLNLSQSLH